MSAGLVLPTLTWRERMNGVSSEILLKKCFESSGVEKDRSALHVLAEQGLGWVPMLEVTWDWFSVYLLRMSGLPILPQRTADSFFVLWLIVQSQHLLMVISIVSEHF